jgi:hypothetical protein
MSHHSAFRSQRELPLPGLLEPRRSELLGDLAADRRIERALGRLALGRSPEALGGGA